MAWGLERLPRATEWFAEIILGLSDAIRERMTPWVTDASSAPVVVLPNYGDEEASPATPLPVTLFSPGLAAMLPSRNRLGIRTPAAA